VLKIDKENEKFSLGIKQLTPNPWDDIQRTYPLGTEIEGEVTSVTDFGAFVRLADGIGDSSTPRSCPRSRSRSRGTWSTRAIA